MSEDIKQENDSDADWFDKDDDEILAELQSKTKVNSGIVTANEVECITGLIATEEYLKAKNVTAAAADSVDNKKHPKISTADLRKMSQMEPLDVFLSAMTHETDFFEGQLRLNDAQDRVLLYMHIVAIICSLELPGFHKDILRNFVRNTILLEQMRTVAIKLFSKRYKALWRDDVVRVDVIVHDIHLLLLQAHQWQVLNEKGLELVKHISELISGSDAPDIVERDVCKELMQHLQYILEAAKLQAIEETPTTISKEIYPNYNELINESDNENTILGATQHKYDSVVDYLNVQKEILREDFMIPLRECVHVLKNTQSLDSLAQPPHLFNDVYILLNEAGLKAHRHELLFIDVLGTKRSSDLFSSKKAYTKTMKEAVQKLKTGALLCLTTSTEFDNLILARITYTDRDVLGMGYIGIEIVRQYNIGNIYNRQLLMFETPAFFEPYHNVYNYLSSCSIANFPMKEYIVNREIIEKKPKYLRENTNYITESAGKLPLNSSQKLAFNRALTERFCLIQGPPGTGKTHLSVHLVKTLMDNVPVTPILLVTYTNDSLDKFLLKLTEHTDNIVRFGSRSRLPTIAKYNVAAMTDGSLVNPALRRLYYLTGQLYKTNYEELQKLYEEFDGTETSYQEILEAQKRIREVDCKQKTIRLMFQYYLARQKGIIAMTSTCAAKSNFLFHLLRTSVVIFEEAAEILESHVIACLTPYTEHVIMIGDHMQLKPYTSTYQHSRSTELNVSLFERLILHGFRPAVLNIQYRMRPEIASLLCPIIYKELNNASIVESYPAVRKMRQSLYFLSHERPEEQDKASICNIYEAMQIKKLANHLITQVGYAPNELVILSPYAFQVKAIEKELSLKKNLKEIRVSTVDSFQGLEANIVLLSLVRSKQIGFLRESNRICVALSRAKHGLYMIGNMTLLAASSKIWQSIKGKLETMQAIGREFPYDFDNCSE